MSAFGDLAYPPDFKNFAYVNPQAPKGGTYSEAVSSRGYNGSFLTFNSLNAYILKGDGAFGMDLTFATLMARSGDEPDAMYGFAARAVRISDDGLTYTFLMRPEAKFHDGTALTAADVVWSLNTLKDKGHPIISQFLRDFKGAEVSGDDAVVVRFAEKRARDVPLFVAGLPIFSRAYYGKHEFDQTTLDAPLGSGAYKVGRFEAGPLHRIPARQGLVGGRAAGGARRQQFRRRALRILPRPRRRLRRLQRRQLPVPRGVHLAHLGDALRLPRLQGRPRQAPRAARRDAVRRAGLVHQHAARAVQGPARARGADATPSTSSGPTRTSCTAPTSARSRCSRTRR